MTDVLLRRPRLLPVPDPNPPYDSDERPWRPPTPPRRGHRQGVLALEFQLSSGIPARPAPFETPHRARMPAPAGWSGLLARAFADALNGTRPPDQLRFWVTGNVHRRLLTAVRAAGRHGPPAYTVRAVHPTVPAPGTVEVAATLHGREHTHAMAFRLEARRGQWMCTALEVGVLPRPR